MRTDEAHLRLTIDVHYELGRTGILDFERVLIEAADHLAANGMLSGETEASVLTWDSGVSEVAPEDAIPATIRHVVETVNETLQEGRQQILEDADIEQVVLAALSVRDHTEQELGALTDWVIETHLRSLMLGLVRKGLATMEWKGDEPMFRKKD